MDLTDTYTKDRLVRQPFTDYLRDRLGWESVWLSLTQRTELVGRNKSAISRYLRNVFTTGEQEREAVVPKNATTAAGGGIGRVRPEWNVNLKLSSLLHI